MATPKKERIIGDLVLADDVGFTPENDEAVPEEETPKGTAYSHLTPADIRDEYQRILGKPATAQQSLLELITAILYQFELQKTLSYQLEASDFVL